MFHVNIAKPDKFMLIIFAWQICMTCQWTSTHRLTVLIVVVIGNGLTWTGGGGGGGGEEKKPCSTRHLI